MPPTAKPHPATGSGAPADQPSAHATRRLLGVVVGLAVVVVVMLCAFALPSINSGPHRVPLGLAGPQQAVQAIQSGLDKDAWTVAVYPDDKALTAAITSRDIVGGLAVAPQGVTVYTASAAGSPTTAAITAMGNGLAVRQQTTSTVHDVVPLPAGDPRGAGFTAAALPMLIGGVLPAVALLRLFPGHAGLRRRLVGVLAFALVAGFAVTAVLQYGFGSLNGAYWLTALGVSLGMAALAVPFLGLESLFGFGGLGVGAAVMMLLGNPLSGFAGPYWLPTGLATVGQLLPPGSSGSLLRANAFFDGVGAAGPALVLAAWVLAGLILIVIADRRTAHNPEHPHRPHTEALEPAAP
ncbi:hypothetical protein [Streptosporangium sp. NPDC051022]|uniref:hypothetical protein n=1 Tax=Streptosporangium sp. NPDC051022 TaxID=3155752 RepID=UPI00343B2413